MSNLSTHDSVLVRKTLAENLASLAETAVRFLEYSQLRAKEREESLESTVDNQVSSPQ